MESGGERDVTNRKPSGLSHIFLTTLFPNFILRKKEVLKKRYIRVVERKVKQMAKFSPLMLFFF